MLVVTIFGVEFLMAFRRATSNPALSGNALNFNWISTHLLHVVYPDNFGGLIEGRFSPIGTDLRLLAIPKLIFILVYALTFLAFLRQKKTFEKLLLYALLGYLTYFTFNTGVYENHLFPATLLAACLLWLDRNHLPTFVIWSLFANLNLFLAFRLTGKESGYLHIGDINTILMSSILEVLFFSWFFITTLFSTKVTK
jgi:hypothetical protein